MNETTTMSDLSEDEQKFADVIFKIIESKYRKYEREHEESGYTPVPLENIHFGPDDFKDFPHIMQGIKPYQEVEKTVEQMLGLLFGKSEIERSRGLLRLTKYGLLHKHLTKKLEGTQ